MALTEKLELLLTADPSQGISALKQFSTEAERTAKSTTSSLQKVGTSALKLGAGGIGVGGFLTQMASGDIEAANKLDAAIGQVGQSQSDYKDRIDATVAAQAKFGHTDEQVKGALTGLTLSYNDAGKALDEMQLVADLAERKQISLGEAATMVARAHGGAAKLFKEFNIQVQANADGTKDYDGALSELARKLQGQAAAGAHSFGGELRMLRAEAENVVSDFGQSFGPAILGVSTLMAGLGGAMTGVGTIMGRLGAARAANVAALEAETVAAAEAATAEAALTVNSAAAVASLYAEATAATTAATALTAVGTAAVFALPVVGALVAVNWSDWMGTNNATDAAKGLKDIATQVRTVRDEDLTTWVDEAVIALGEMGDTAAKSERGLKIFNEVLADSPQDAQRTADALAAAGIVIPDVTAKIDAQAQAQRDAAARSGEWTTAVDGNTDALKKLRTAADDAYTATLKLAPADIRVKQGALQISDARARQAQAEQDLADARAAGDPKKIAQAERDLADAGLAYVGAVQDEATAVADLKETQDKANGITETAATKTGNYLDALTFLNAGLTGPTHDALNGYIWDATVARNRTDDLLIAAENLATFNATGGVAPNAAGMVVLGGSPLAREGKQAGGPVVGGSSYLIGERGPELFTPGVSGYITPHGQLGTGDKIIHQHFYRQADAADQQYEAARRLRIEAMLSTP